MGAFYHEAAAVASDGRIYMTEDRGNGGFYRFTPVAPTDLSSGLLEVATGSTPGPVVWAEVPNPSGSPLLRHHQVPAMMRFDGGEGIDTLGDSIWFTTKGDNRVGCTTWFPARSACASRAAVPRCSRESTTCGLTMPPPPC